jgi:hypothetical protein
MHVQHEIVVVNLHHRTRKFQHTLAGLNGTYDAQAFPGRAASPKMRGLLRQTHSVNSVGDASELQTCETRSLQDLASRQGGDDQACCPAQRMARPIESLDDGLGRRGDAGPGVLYALGADGGFHAPARLCVCGEHLPTGAEGPVVMQAHDGPQSATLYLGQSAEPKTRKVVDVHQIWLNV